MPRKSQKTNATCAAKNTPKDIPSKQTPPNVEYGQFFETMVTSDQTRILSKYGTPKRTAHDHSYSKTIKEGSTKRKNFV